jgi:hypothetical protein
MIDFGLFFFDLAHSAEAMRLRRELAAAASRDVTVVMGAVTAPPAPFVPEQYHFQPGFAVLAAGFGNGDEHSRLAARVRESLPPLFDHVAPMPYVELQQLLDEANAWGLRCYEKALYLDELTDDAIATFTQHASSKSGPLSHALIIPFDGAYQDVDDHDTAWGGNRAGYGVFVIGLATAPEQLDAERSWVRSLWGAVMPHASSIGAYVNTLAPFEDDRVRASYGLAKYERLARIEAVYDPDNVFHRNANIRPAPPSVFG